MLVKSKLICLITILLLNLIATSSATTSNSITTLPALPAISLPSDTNNPDLSNSMNNSWWNKIKSFFGFNVESEQNKLEANNVQNIENSFNNDFPSNNEKLESNQLNTKSHNFITLDNNSLPRLHDDDNTDIELAELPDILKATQMQDNNMQTKLNINQTQELHSQINRNDSQKQDYTSSSQGYQTQITKSHKPKINNTNNLTALLKLPVPTQSLREQHHNMQSTTQDFSNKYEVINNLNQLENTQSELEQQTQTTSQDSKVSLSLNFEEYKEKNIDTSNSLSLISNQQETINSETTLKQQPDLPLTTTLNENNADNNNSSNTEPNSDVTDIDLTHNPDKNSIPLVDNYANQALSNDTSSTNNDTDDTDDDTASASILDSNTNSDAIQLQTNDNSSTANTDNISTILKTDDADINNINLDIQNNNQDIETSMISELENHETNINTSDVNEFTINTNHDTNNNSQNETSEQQAEPSSTSIQTTDSNQSDTDNSTQMHNNYDATSSNANSESQIDTTKTKIDIKPRDSVELSMFLDRELIILTAENDDIELGQLTDKAKLKLIDDWKYIKLIEKEINYRKEASKRQAVNNIIQYHRMKTKKMQDLTQKDAYISKCYK
ncbi:hypothetical protein ACA348_10070 [Orientia tsutsugamushi]|uniref:hypothetical protein n=1 Tax=Orientia tsutsugamushi TaxID=784 RepID=UPI003526D788